MVQIIPAILDKTPEDFTKHMEQLKNSASFQEGWVHIDFADNIFVPNKTIRPFVIAKYPIDLHKEAHLMVLHPLEWVDDLIKAGFERAIFHIEAEDNIEDCIRSIKTKGLEIGLAINNDTPVAKLEPFASELDAVLVMAIVPGFQGHEFIPATLDRIKETSHLRSKGNFSFRIGVDGAVKNDNIREIVEAGADFVTVGSYLLNGDIDENLGNLWERLNE